MAASGLPALLNEIAADYTGQLLTSDGISYTTLGYAPQWGIFLNGEPVVTADTIAELSFKQEWVLSDYPVEGGAFADYDKVYTPYDVRVTYTAGGSPSNRQALLDSIQAIAPTLDLFDVAMPEMTFVSCNIVHWDFRRTSSNGVGLMQVPVWLNQVNVVGSNPDFSNTGSPSGANPVNDGSIQPSPLLDPASLLATAIIGFFN